MKRFFPALILLAAVLTLCQQRIMAENTKTTVEQVTTAVTISDDVDYIITGATPFAGEGVINITNTDHAVLILDAIKPSKIAAWLKYININGVRASNNTNCQVKLHNLGCIILPYRGGDSFKPLTVYSEQDFKGDSCNDFGLEHSDGYMNTLTDAKLNNRIRSFKLKRGYMVTFSLKSDGRGYSRCFIAADKDVEMNELPSIMDNSISSYRVFKWYDAGKKQLANYINADAMAALNVQSSYDWGTGNASMLPDYEWVPNHIYEDYPSSRAIGRSTWSPHTKNNNEPKNSSDDHPQDLNTILNNWENMMRTGLRLCSPASWDGSDYWNATGFLADFLDSIDARGWRCDIIDLHCYWAEGSFGNIVNWANKYNRPVWISEWCWGASWNNNGAFASGVTEAQVRDALERICTRLNGMDYVERYYYWNSERDPSRVYKDGSLTPAGTYYSAMNSGVGYNGKYDFVPKTPKQYAPKDLTVTYNKSDKTAFLTWYEYNGEMNKSITIERRPGRGKAWITVAEITPKDEASSYEYTDSDVTNGSEYRIHVIDANKKDHYTDIVMAASSDLQAGDAIDLDGNTKYLGGNVILNGNFEMGAFGWKDGKGNQPAAPYFQVVPVGGNDNGAYLQAYGNGALSTEMAINTSFSISENSNYYFSVASCNMPSGYTNRLGLSKTGVNATTAKVYINNATSNWLTQYGTFNSGEYNEARVNLYNLASAAQLDQMLLCKLYDTREEAVADGVEVMRQKAELFKQYNSSNDVVCANLNADLTATLAAVTATDEEALATLSEAVANAILAYDAIAEAQKMRLFAYADSLIAFNLYGVETLSQLRQAAADATTSKGIIDSYGALEDYILEYLPQTNSGKVTNPNFASVNGWTTKCGTYTEGDQRTGNDGNGISYWNAWWSGIGADDTNSTMAISQSVKSLTHGLYTLECKASTEHFCLSDQHGFLVSGNDTLFTQTLSADYIDLPSVADADRWQTLTTVPVYVDQNGTLTFGFISSKKGATDGMWLERGLATGQKNDKREGWWRATDFTLKHSPLYRETVVPNQWSTICLPYDIHPTATQKFYQIAGINADYTQLFLTEVEQPLAGVPYIYRSSVSDAQFLEFGEAVTRPVSGYVNNLRGFLVTAASVQPNYFYISDGSFVKVGSSGPKIGNYRGVLCKFDDNKATGIPVLDSWDGETMPIEGVTEDDKTANMVKTSISVANTLYPVSSDAEYYSPDGRRITNKAIKPGVYIKVVGGHAYKIMVK